ncbi:kinase-like protein [Sanghuangporus baumii]|uniref:Kinase-like protein n=1 Tax=Sanghuangporus baumii TaxID=108892 RepID=A0A9Q5HXI7_SANBA|nr:kinase-like protein [Sanghuangporus baumii]
MTSTISIEAHAMYFIQQAASSSVKRRRLLDESIDSSASERTVKSCRVRVAPAGHGECARLVTTSKAGRREVIVLTLDRPVTIGRNPRECTYVIEDKVVSSVHCKLYALDSVLSSTGGVLDESTNGVILNGYKLRHHAAMVMHGDEIEIPNSQVFNGSYASVHLAFDAVSFRQVACKTIISKCRGKDDMQKAIKEVNILKKLKHPNICGILDVEMNSKAGWLHIFLELCTGGDLFTYTAHRFRLGEAEAKFITYQLFQAIGYLHDRSISHRGLDAPIVLEGPFPRVQIADFGLARTRAYQETMTVCGTVSYLPPEGVLALDNKELAYVGMPADCWSVGLILYIMLTGLHPFDYMDGEVQHKQQYAKSRLSQLSQGSLVNEQVIKTRIIKCIVEFSAAWDSMPDAKNLTEGLLVRDHTRRMTIQDALRSEWITRDLDDLLHDYNERLRN